MFERLPDAVGDPVPVTIDGVPFAARSTDSVAAALLASGRLACRTTPVRGVARGPYCMMAVCFDCLVTIDGRPNQQGCQVPVAPGMAIETQQGVRAVSGGVVP
jgi:predicted molibdopterin-dependent oxidoreductase YjgC